MRKNYEIKTVVQNGTRTGRCYNKGSDGKPIGSEMIKYDIPFGTKKCYTYKPLVPQIKMSYFTVGTSPQSSRVYSEEYELINGEYRLTSAYYESANEVTKSKERN